MTTGFVVLLDIIMPGSKHTHILCNCICHVSNFFSKRRDAGKREVVLRTHESGGGDRESWYLFTNRTTSTCFYS